MRYFLFLILLSSGVNLGAQANLPVTITMNDGSIMEILMKAPFQSGGKNLKYKLSENEQYKKLAKDDIKLAIIFPGTDSEIILKNTRYNLNKLMYSHHKEEAIISKYSEWVRLVDSCDGIEFFEAIASVDISKSEIIIFYPAAGGSFYSYYLQRPEEEIPTCIATHLNPLWWDYEGNKLIQSQNHRLMSTYFEDNPKILEKLNGVIISRNTIHKIFRFICD